MSFTWLDSYDNCKKMVFSEFEELVRTNVDEDDEDIASRANLIVMTNNGLRELATKEVIREYCEIDCDGSDYYELPEDLIKVKSAVWITGGGVEYLTKATSTDSDAMQGYYSIRGSRLFVYGGIAAGKIRVYASRMPEKITSASSEVDIQYDYLNVLSLYVEWRYWKRKRSIREANDAYSVYQLALKELEVKNEQKNEQGVKLFGKISSTRR